MAFGQPVSHDAFEEILASSSPGPAVDLSPPLLTRQYAHDSPPSPFPIPPTIAHVFAGGPEHVLSTEIPMVDCVTALRSLAYTKLPLIICNITLSSLIRNLGKMNTGSSSLAKSTCIQKCIEALHEVRENPFMCRTIWALTLTEIAHRLETV